MGPEAGMGVFSHAPTSHPKTPHSTDRASLLFSLASVAGGLLCKILQQSRGGLDRRTDGIGE
jgi:hypothetical protein